MTGVIQRRENSNTDRGEGLKTEAEIGVMPI